MDFVRSNQKELLALVPEQVLAVYIGLIMEAFGLHVA